MDATYNRPYEGSRASIGESEMLLLLTIRYRPPQLTTLIDWLWAFVSSSWCQLRLVYQHIMPSLCAKFGSIAIWASENAIFKCNSAASNLTMTANFRLATKGVLLWVKHCDSNCKKGASIQLSQVVLDLYWPPSLLCIQYSQLSNVFTFYTASYVFLSACLRFDTAMISVRFITSITLYWRRIVFSWTKRQWEHRNHIKVSKEGLYTASAASCSHWTIECKTQLLLK